VRVEAEIVQQEFNPQFAQIAAPSDMVLVVSFELRIGDKKGTATICVPFSTLAPVLEHLASQSLFQDQRGEDPEQWRDRLAEALYRVPVELRVRFATVALTSAEIVSLTVGDVVPLGQSTDEPVMVSVDDVHCYDAVTGRHGKRLACLVVGTNREAGWL
jgi:flagellar motor switch protein FliM